MTSKASLGTRTGRRREGAAVLPKRKILLVSSHLLLLALIGCGGDSGNAAPTGPGSVAVTPVSVDNVSTAPDRPSVLSFDGSDDRVTVPYSPCSDRGVHTRSLDPARTAGSPGSHHRAGRG